MREPPGVSPFLRERAARLGAPGAAWLAGLAGLVADVGRAWSLTVGPPLAGGTASYVVRVRTGDGRDAVLKLVLRRPESRGQARVLAHADGHGYVHLLAHDPDRDALLLEALGPSAADLAPAGAIDVLCATLRRAWQAPPPPLDPVPEKAGQLGRTVARLQDELGGPCSRAVVEEALRCAANRAAAFRPERCVVVHGDPHPGNALRVLAARPGAESGFVFVDPDGFRADPAYDLGVVLRDWCPQLLAGDAPALARRYCRRLAARTGVDEDAIWEWGFLERVSTGLHILDLGAPDLARPFLVTAGMLAV